MFCNKWEVWIFGQNPTDCEWTLSLKSLTDLTFLSLFKTLMLLNLSYFIVFLVFVIILNENLPMSYTVVQMLPIITKNIYLMQLRIMSALFRLNTLTAHHYFTIDQSTQVYRLQLLSLQFIAKVPVSSDTTSILWDTAVNAWDTSSCLLWKGPQCLAFIPHFTPLLSCHCQHQVCQC